MCEIDVECHSPILKLISSLNFTGQLLQRRRDCAHILSIFTSQCIMGATGRWEQDLVSHRKQDSHVGSGGQWKQCEGKPENGTLMDPFSISLFIERFIVKTCKLVARRLKYIAITKVRIQN